MIALSIDGLIERDALALNTASNHARRPSATKAAGGPQFGAVGVYMNAHASASAPTMTKIIASPPQTISRLLLRCQSAYCRETSGGGNHFASGPSSFASNTKSPAYVDRL